MTRHVFRLPLLGVIAVASSVEAADTSAYVLLTTDYVFRGVTYSDGHAAGQIGVDVAFDNGVFIGAWASSVDIEVEGVAERDLEADFYVGYSHGLTSDWTLGGTVVAYTFPGAEGPFDYDYVEYSANLNYDDRLWFEYAFAPDVFGTGASAHNYSIFSEYPLPNEFAASVGAGFYDLTDLSGSDYAYWEAGVARPFGQLSVDLRYHDASDWVPIWSNPDRVDARIVLSAEYRF